jgi:hypothetical protein
MLPEQAQDLKLARANRSDCADVASGRVLFSAFAERCAPAPDEGTSRRCPYSLSGEEAGVDWSAGRVVVPNGCWLYQQLCSHVHSGAELFRADVSFFHASPCKFRHSFARIVRRAGEEIGNHGKLGVAVAFEHGVE